MLAPSTRVDFGWLTTKAREEGARYADYRHRLSPELSEIAFREQETGEYDERRLNHSDGEAERFYRELKQRGVRVRVGMEATGYSRWFERLLAELGSLEGITVTLAIAIGLLQGLANGSEITPLMSAILEQAQGTRSTRS
jgi:hypothetical protein